MEELSAFHWLFVMEYLKDYNGAAAIKRAGYKGKYASQEANRLMHKPKIKAETERFKMSNLNKVKLEVEDIWRDVSNVLKGDVRSIVEHHRGSCRYCHGVNHEYQFKPQEMRDERAKWAVSEYGLAGILFDEKGGLGYDSRKDPHPDCPECEGRGVEILIAHDTRHLSPEAAALFDGFEPGKHGTKFKMRSRDAARDLAARALGMSKTELVLTPGKAKEMTDDELAAIAASKARE